MSRLYQLLCEHKKLELITIDYCTETISTTIRDHKIACTVCGKMIVPIELFDKLHSIFTGVEL